MSDYTTLFRNIQDEAFELFKRKNADYGNSFEEYGTIGILIRMSDKIKRAQTITNNNVTLIDSAIQKSNLGLNPQIDGQMIRLPIPSLSEERRNEIKKMTKSMGEQCKISIRNIRREANEELKKLLKAKEIAEDEEKKEEKNIQNITDDSIKKIDDKVSLKEKEIMTI